MPTLQLISRYSQWQAPEMEQVLSFQELGNRDAEHSVLFFTKKLTLPVLSKPESAIISAGQPKQSAIRKPQNNA